MTTFGVNALQNSKDYAGNTGVYNSAVPCSMADIICETKFSDVNYTKIIMFPGSAEKHVARK
jgi:hypothetical protein